MIRHIADLAAGRVPLAEAFWTYAIFWGFLINMAATLTSLGLVAAKAANWAALAAHLAPIPWNLLVLVAVWRSAAHPQVPRPLAAAARAITFVWSILLSAL
jgi:hypothetical protein